MYLCKDGLSGINGVLRPGIVHRIDKDTSGLLIVAKNDASHQFLAEQIKEHSFTREYEAVAIGRFKTSSGDIDLPIGRHPVKRKQMAVTSVNSKPAKTHFEVLGESQNLSYLRLKLFTGRTHQIRVHMSYLGHPLVGDDVYGRVGKEFKNLCGQCLHAKKIGFIHPTTKEYIEFESDLPEYFKNLLKNYELNV
jgi:23S rRNA pseudouridine1911/1915/1917 synthase